ncbi:MAG: archease [Desulfosudaceae bacterium]
MTANPRYRFFEHTADLGLEIPGRDLPELFTNACFALFDILAAPDGLVGEQNSEISVSGGDTPDLLINWLRELLAQWTVYGRLVAASDIMFFAGTELRARLDWDEFDPARHRLKTEIKAVTYHALDVVQTDRGCRARVVLDL